MSGMRILVADDSALYRRILAQAIEATATGTEVIAVENGSRALEELERGRIDACLLDVNMPVMDGIETLRRIKQAHPQMPVIMISGGSKDSAKLTVQALGLGALDFILKPLDRDFGENMHIISVHLRDLFRQLRKAPQEHAAAAPEMPKSAPMPVPTVPRRRAAFAHVDLVVIASSTGGPGALEQLVPRLSDNFAKPVLIVQHMPAEFTKVFAESLQKKSRVEVAEAAAGDVVQAGKVYIAPGGYHMRTQKDSATRRVIHLEQSDFVCGVRPSADVLFQSVAEAYENMNVLAVVLTGMGKDGTAGVTALKERTNCHCISQSEGSCVVYGMPRSVDEAGLSDEVADIEQMAQRIETIVLQGLR